MLLDGRRSGRLRREVWPEVVVLAGVVAALTVGLSVVGVDEAAGRTATTLTVCASGSGGFSTIQDAVDAANDGDTIAVCAGTYREQVVIDKNGLTLMSMQKQQATIQAPADLPATQDSAIVEVRAATGVTISGFTISGPAAAASQGAIGFGVLIDSGGEATVTGNHITAIRDNPMTGAQNGWAIRANSATLTATGNKIDDYQKAGIDVRGTGAVGTIKDNTIVGAGRTDVIGQNGIVVSRGASGTVSGNTVSDNFYSPNTNTATGILVFLDPGEVTVENNTLRDNQTNIYVCCLRPDVTVTVSGNSTSGGNEGIHVEAASGVRITDNKTTGAANFGLLATNDASDNTFDGNKASGVTGDGNYDCADQSVGDKTATTANTWTKNTGDTVSPDGICSPPGATPAPTPTPPATTEPPGGGPIDDLEVPPVIVVSDVPVTPPSKPADAANPSVPTTPTGSQKAAQTAQNVVATMHEKQLSACALGLTTTDGQKKLVARGFATAPQSGTGRMIITVRAVPGGKLLLEAHFGGVLALAHAKCITTANGKPTGTVTAFKTALIVLRVEHTVTAPGTFLPDKAVFTPNGKQFLTELRARITAPLLMRCDGYTAVYPPSRVDAHTLSTQRAEVACRLLNQKHLVRPPKIVAHGHTDPIATNSTEAGRRHNRRVEVTVVHRVQPQV